MADVIATDKRVEVLELISRGISHREISKRTGLSLGAISNIRNGPKEFPLETTATPAGTDKRVEAGDQCEIDKSFNTPIRTEKDALAACEVDTSVWFVEKFETSCWSMPIKVRNNGKEEVVQQQQYRVKLWLRRIMPKPVEEATNAIFDRMAKHAINYGRTAYRNDTRAESQSMAVFCLFDAHFGKMCWARETGDNYDLNIAELVFSNAVDDMIAECTHRNVTSIVLPIGNDFFHIDNSKNTTYNNTPQDVDGRYAKMVECGEMAVIRAVERLTIIAPVSVIWVPGNHDPTTSYHLARTVKAWFSKSESVTVDTEPTTRKYVHWGTNLVGFTHGNEERKEALPALMANECRELWADTTCREWLTGHLHSSKAWTTKPLETQDGMVIRTLRSLAGTDAWHARKGYLNLSKAAEVYFYHASKGYVGHSVVPVRN